MKIIETNLAFNSDGSLNDFQSRILEDVSWNQYIEDTKNNRNIIEGSVVENLKYNNYRLSFDFVRIDKVSMQCLAYLVDQ